MGGNLRRGAIVLAVYPFTDLSSVKRRPALEHVSKSSWGMSLSCPERALNRRCRKRLKSPLVGAGSPRPYNARRPPAWTPPQRPRRRSPGARPAIRIAGLPGAVLTAAGLPENPKNFWRAPLVVSATERLGRDCILAFITSRTERIEVADLALDPADGAFAATGLRVPSAVRCGKLMTLDRALLTGRLGQLDERLMAEVDARLKKALALQ